MKTLGETMYGNISHVSIRQTYVLHAVIYTCIVIKSPTMDPFKACLK